ncbi:hypothetical protein DM860_007333 [Cuscuta australis]|uniref:Histidinol-phosphatase n=1 Tax=Cuscuta australis TaxID=267555 RepID=A0A328E4U4_9ASTE|nr:hypothetical protein DM860_007333 [Cuscuta australis]
MADREAERAMVEIIQENFPSHAIYGEETGWYNSKEGYEKPEFVWVLDPIDGTTSYIAGHGCISLLFGVLIGLVYRGKPFLGCIDQPVSGYRWMGVRGRISTLNGKPTSTVACEDLGLANAYLKSPYYSEDSEFAYDKTVSKVKTVKYDGNCIAYGALASGFSDLVIDSGLDPFDFLAVIPVVEGAGGVITDWQGRDWLWDPNPADPSSGIPDGGFKIVAAGDPIIHSQVIALLADEC